MEARHGMDVEQPPGSYPGFVSRFWNPGSYPVFGESIANPPQHQVPTAQQHGIESQSPLYLNGRVPACGTGYPGSIPGSGTLVLHPCTPGARGPKTSWPWQYKTKQEGTGGNRTPFSRTQAGNRTSRPQSHRRLKAPAQNGIRTRTNPGMRPCGIRTRACFSKITFQLVGVERTVRTNRCNW